jgi:perosamine synthetase
MPRFFMPIAAAFAPNYTLRDVIIACGQLLPWNWKQLQSGKNIPRFEEEFRKYMDVQKAVSFDSGRAGFYAILKAMDVQEGDEIILQAFTTVALPNTIQIFGAKPVYVDIEESTYNMNPEKIESNITSKTKAIVIQHTFGNPADIDQIFKIAKKYDLKTIEDCAHSLGAKYKGEKTGTFADAAFFSFGRDKVISSVAGGMVIANNYELIESIEAVRNGMPFPEKRAIMKKLLHPIITFKALHTYNLFSVGKIIMFLSYRLNILDKAYTNSEKRGEPKNNFAKRMPNALAAIGIHQLKLLSRFNRRRTKISQMYAKNIHNELVQLPKTLPISKNIFLWYTINIKNKKGLIKKAADNNIILGDWFPQVIGPIEVDLKKSRYVKGSCPIAEKVSSMCVNLPTHHNINKKDAQQVIDLINNFK